MNRTSEHGACRTIVPSRTIRNSSPLATLTRTQRVPSARTQKRTSSELSARFESGLRMVAPPEDVARAVHEWQNTLSLAVSGDPCEVPGHLAAIRHRPASDVCKQTGQRRAGAFTIPVHGGPRRVGGSARFLRRQAPPPAKSGRSTARQSVEGRASESPLSCVCAAWRRACCRTAHERSQDVFRTQIGVKGVARAVTRR